VCPKAQCTNPTEVQTLADSYDVSACAISTFYIYPYKILRTGTENFFRRDNSVKNHRTMTKFKLKLHIPIKYPYITFKLNA
jgi:hypothetical protein